MQDLIVFNRRWNGRQCALTNQTVYATLDTRALKAVLVLTVPHLATLGITVVLLMESHVSPVLPIRTLRVTAHQPQRASATQGMSVVVTLDAQVVVLDFTKTNSPCCVQNVPRGHTLRRRLRRRVCHVPTIQFHRSEVSVAYLARAMQGIPAQTVACALRAMPEDTKVIPVRALALHALPIRTLRVTAHQPKGASATQGMSVLVTLDALVVVLDFTKTNSPCCVQNVPRGHTLRRRLRRRVCHVPTIQFHRSEVSVAYLARAMQGIPAQTVACALRAMPEDTKVIPVRALALHALPIRTLRVTAHPF